MMNNGLLLTESANEDHSYRNRTTEVAYNQLTWPGRLHGFAQLETDVTDICLS